MNFAKNKNTSGPTRIWETGDDRLHTPCASGRPEKSEPSFLSKQIVWDPPIKIEKYILDGKTGFEPVTTLESLPQIDPTFKGPNNAYASATSGCTKTNGDTHCESKDFQHMAEPHAVNRKDISFNVEYIRLSKEARVWDSQGQHKLANESNRRAECILKGDTKGYEQCSHSNVLYNHTNKCAAVRLHKDRAQGSPCFVICEHCKGYSGNHITGCPNYVERNVDILDEVFAEAEGAVEGTVVVA